MTEYRLFDPESPPEWLDPEWWRDHPHCDHLGSPTGAHRQRLVEAAKAAVAATALIDCGGGHDMVTDLGAGDGALLSLLPPHIRTESWGYEIIREDVGYACGVRNVEVHRRNVREGLEKGSLILAPIVVLTEVLEHMADPHGFLELLHARDEVEYVVASSPWGETPDKNEPNHAWAWDVPGYREMFNAAGFEEIEFRRVEWSQLWTFRRAPRRYDG